MTRLRLAIAARRRTPATGEDPRVAWSIGELIVLLVGAGDSCERLW